MRRRALFLVGSLAGALELGCEWDSCFVAGTRIATPRGAVPIESLRVGDVVLAYSHAAGAGVRRRVAAVHRARVSEVRTVHHARDEGGRRVRGMHRATPSHPVCVPSRRQYVAIRDLGPGDAVLYGLTDGAAWIESIVAIETAQPSIDVSI